MFRSRKSPGLWAVTLLAFVFALVVPCTAALAGPAAKAFDIIEITDFHGTLEDTGGNPVAAVMAKNIKDIVDGNPERTLLVSGGDNYQGSAVSNLLKGEPVMNVLNNIGVEVSALGNDFLAAGGDRFDICRTVDFSGTHILLREALAENIRQAGHISAQIEGRIRNVLNADPEQITRAEFASLLAHALGLAGNESAAGFSDVFPGQEFAEAIGVAAQAGLVNGYEDGSFRPNHPISREEITVIAIRTVEVAGFTAEVSDVNAAVARFNDGEDISGWARIPVAAAVEAGIVRGRETGDFDPSEHATRAEAAAILERTLLYINS